MKNLYIGTLLSVVIVFVVAGCGLAGKQTITPAVSETGPGRTIGSLAEIVGFEPVAVEGYGLVAGLAGTGSSQCPPELRTYLQQYILRQLSKTSKLSAEELIESEDTAVVRIVGFIPPGASSGQRFDVKVSALPATQTTSLAGGYLYTAELSPYTKLGKSTRILATAQGPIFNDFAGGEGATEKTGYVLGGGFLSMRNVWIWTPVGGFGFEEKPFPLNLPP